MRRNALSILFICFILICLLGMSGCSTDKVGTQVDIPVRSAEFKEPDTTTELLTTTEETTTAAPTTTTEETTTAAPTTTTEETTTAAPTTAPETTTAPAPEIHTYVLNTNTKKIHIIDCKSVSQMKESNKKFVEGTLEEILDTYSGYTVCGNCNARY